MNLKIMYNPFYSSSSVMREAFPIKNSPSSQDYLILKVCKFLLEYLFSFKYRFFAVESLTFTQGKKVIALEKMVPSATYQGIANSKAVKTAMMSIIGLIGGVAYHRYCPKAALSVPVESSFAPAIFIPALVVSALGVLVWAQRCGNTESALRGNKEENPQVLQLLKDVEMDSSIILGLIEACYSYIEEERGPALLVPALTGQIQKEFKEKLRQGLHRGKFSKEDFLSKKENVLRELQTTLFAHNNKIDKNIFDAAVFSFLKNSVEEAFFNLFSACIRFYIPTDLEKEKTQEITEAVEIVLGVIRLKLQKNLMPWTEEQIKNFRVSSKKDQFTDFAGSWSELMLINIFEKPEFTLLKEMPQVMKHSKNVREYINLGIQKFVNDLD